MLENHIRDDHASSAALITLLLKLDSEATIERVLTMVIGGGSHAQAQPPLAQQTHGQPSSIGDVFGVAKQLFKLSTEEKKAIDRMMAEQKTLSGGIRMIPHLIEDAALLGQEKYLAAYRAGYTQQNPNVASYQVTDKQSSSIVWKTGKEFEEGEEQRRPSSPKLRVSSSKAIYVEDDSDNDEVHAQYKPTLGQYIEVLSLAEMLDRQDESFCDIFKHVHNGVTRQMKAAGKELGLLLNVYWDNALRFMAFILRDETWMLNPVHTQPI
ncbi:hypothetical protein BC829DRAFT_448545 [Chytridium lagenaria]|nr:hypothetical protein BC829DRAFT_448545 [Chytridium lagenaria]